METNNKTQQWTWAVVVLVIIVFLMLGAKKGNAPQTPAEVNTEATASSTEEAKSTSTVSPVRTVSSYKKPAGNVVELTANGFTPFILEIKRGDSVEFLNSSDKAMVIHSYDNKPENVYPGFSQASAPLGKGGKFYFGFSTPGAWAYYNLNSPNDQGVIIVK